MKFFNIFSKQSFGSGQSVDFLFCPSCRVERTIETRQERIYYCFCGIPLFAVSGTEELARCLTCQLVIPRYRLLQSQDANLEKQQEQLFQIIGQTIHYLGIQDPEDLLSLSHCLERHGLALPKGEKMPGRLEQVEWSEQPLIAISRNSDPLSLLQRETLLAVFADWLRTAQFSDLENRLLQLAIALGLSESKAAEILRSRPTGT